MNKMIVLAKAAEGRKAELADWYDNRHIPDLLAVPGFIAAERHDAIPIKVAEGSPAWDFMLIYEFEGDPMAALQGMGNLFGTARMPVTDALESASTVSIVGISKGRRTD